MPHRSSTTGTSTPRTTAACSPGTIRDPAPTTMRAGPTPARPRKPKKTPPLTVVTRWRGPARRSTGPRATKRSSTRAASSRLSSGTTPATRRRWSKRYAERRRSSSSRSPTCWQRTQDVSEPAPSATRLAGRSRATARKSFARQGSCNSCLATWGAPAAASWHCEATHRSRDRPTCRRCSICCPAIFLTRP